MFRGQFYHTIDPKGRLSIPAKFREALADGHGEKLVIAPITNSLQVHPHKMWEELERKVSALPRFDEDARKLRYFFLSLGQDVALDSQGRIQISADYRERVGLVKNVVVVGAIEHFEVWSAERWIAYGQAHGEPVEAIFNRLGPKGV